MGIHELIKVNFSKLDLIARIICKSNQDQADDLLQTSLARAIKKQHQFSEGTNFIAWCSTIMRNSQKNEWKKERNDKDNLKSLYSKSQTNVGTKKGGDGGSAEVQILPVPALITEEDKRLSFLRACKKQLSEGHRSIIDLSMEMKFVEIAKVLDINLNTVLAASARGRKKLLECIKLKQLEQQKA